MTTTPDWVTQIPSAPVHQPQPGSQLTRPFTSQQLQQIGIELIEQFLRKVLLAIVGIFVPGISSFDQLQDWAQNMQAQVDASTDALAQMLDDILGTGHTISDFVDWLQETRDNSASGLAFQTLITNMLGGTATWEDLQTWLEAGKADAEAAQDKWAELFDSLLGTGHVVQDFVDWLQDTSDTATTASTDFGTHINDMVSQFLGGTWIEQTTADAATVMGMFFNNMQSNTQRITALEQNFIGGGNSGNSFVVNFGEYPDGDLPSMYTVTYFGSGTSTLGVTDGQACWRTLVNDDDRAAIVVYNAGQLESDWQIVRGTMGQPPGDSGINGAPRIWALARVDDPDDPQNFVWARAYQVSWLTFRADLGVRISGTDTVWQSNIPLTWSMDIFLVAGVGNNPHKYQIWSGSTLVKEYEDTGDACPLGNYYHGAISEMREGLLGVAHTPGTLVSGSAADNAPPAVPGSGAHIYRTGTGTVSLNGSSTPAIIANNFFGNTRYATTDLTVDLTTGKFTASISGLYDVKASVKMSTAGYATCWLVLYKTPSGGSPAVYDWAPPTYPGYSDFQLGGSWTVPLGDGDAIQLGACSNGITGNFLTGESSGKQTYFNVALLNKSLL